MASELVPGDFSPLKLMRVFADFSQGSQTRLASMTGFILAPSAVAQPCMFGACLKSGARLKRGLEPPANYSFMKKKKNINSRKK